MTQKLLKLSFTVLAFPAGSSKETANPQKAVTVIRHQALPSVSLGAQFAGHQSKLLQATSLQGEWQNLSISSAAQGLKDAQHPFSESLCSEFGIQSIQQPSSHGSFRITESQLCWVGRDSSQSSSPTPGPTHDIPKITEEQQNSPLRDRGGFKSIPISERWRDTCRALYRPGFMLTFFLQKVNPSEKLFKSHKIWQLENNLAGRCYLLLTSRILKISIKFYTLLSGGSDCQYSAQWLSKSRTGSASNRPYLTVPDPCPGLPDFLSPHLLWECALWAALAPGCLLLWCSV